jgi:hypothetical protein
MKRRTWAALVGLAVTAALPAAAKADLAISADASSSTYAAGHMAGKSWTAYFAGGDVKSITFAQPIYPQINVPAAATLVNSAYGAGHAIGTVRILIAGAPAPAELRLETGDATACVATAPDVNVPAPASEFADPVTLPNVTGLMRVVTTSLGLGFQCVGIRVDATSPNPGVDPGVVKLKIDITPIANIALGAGLHLKYAEIELDNTHVTTPYGPYDLFETNPLGDMANPPWSITDSITAVPCVATTMPAAPCGAGGQEASASVTETVGGSTGVTATLSKSTIVFGSPVTVSGTVTRGTTPSLGEEVDVYHELLGPIGILPATLADGHYSIVLHPAKSGLVFVSAWGATTNTLYASDLHVTVVAPKPVVAKKAVAKSTGSGKYSVSFTIRRVSGITYMAKFGTKALTVKKTATTVVFTGKGLKLKKGSVAVVTASAAGITKATLSVKLK